MGKFFKKDILMAILLWLRKYWNIWIPILIAIVAVYVSVRANHTAADALETSKYQFVQINRPYIILSLKKYDNGQFWEVTQIDKAVEVKIKYEIKNVGNVAAKNISLPDKIKVDIVGPKVNPKQAVPIIFQKPGKITLGPGDSFITEARLRMEYDNAKDARKNKEYHISDEYEGDIFQLSIDYTNELEGSQKYRTFVLNKIHNNEAQIIKSETLTLE